ncbi:MAG: AAA family ATPase, partial [Candidatus Binatia bacterium]
MLNRLCRLPARQSCLLLGPRQTGKTTLVRASLPGDAFSVDLLAHDSFLRYSKDPSLFRSEVEARLRAGARTVFVDEIQKIPSLLDEIHGLIERTGARFLLTGSSARKLRRAPANLLAGRAATRRLHPLTAVEIGSDFSLPRALRFGTLPPVATSDDERARDVLES